MDTTRDEKMGAALEALLKQPAGEAALCATGLVAWSKQQLCAVDLGNARRAARFEQLLSLMMQRPQQSLPVQCQSEARLKATYLYFVI